MIAPEPGTRPVRLLLFINPASGQGRGADAGAEAAARLRSAGVEVDVVETNRAQRDGVDGPVPDGPAQARLTRPLQDQVERQAPDAVIVVGGDGMVHAAVNVLACTDIPLGLIPAGTGNDVARTLGLDGITVREAVDRILCSFSRPHRSVDLLRVELSELPASNRGQADSTDGRAVIRWVAGSVNLGFDAVVNARANALSHPRGKGRYVVAVLRELWGYRAPMLEVAPITGTGEPAVPEPPQQAATFVLSVLNGRYFGGGMQAAPAARQDDGLLDVLWVPTLSPWRFLRVFPRVFSGRHTTVPEVRLWQQAAVSVRRCDHQPGPPAPMVHGDGEPLGLLPARITAVTGALRLLSTDS